MIHHTRRVLEFAALLAVLALPVPVAAQDASRPATPPEEAPAGQAAPGETRQVTPTRPVEDPVEARRAAAARAAAAAEAEEGGDTAPRNREILSKMRDEEIRHRERLATIQRLREIAESQGQAERMAQLDKLEVKEGARYNAATNMAATKLGSTPFYKQSLMKLAGGRIRRNAPKEEQSAPKLTPEERAARQQQKKAAERAAKQPAEPPKSDAPKDEAPNGEAPKQQRQQAQAADQATAPGTQTARAQVAARQVAAERTQTAQRKLPAERAQPAARKALPNATRTAAPVKARQVRAAPAARSAPRKPASRTGSTTGSRSPRSHS